MNESSNLAGGVGHQGLGCGHAHVVVARGGHVDQLGRLLGLGRHLDAEGLLLSDWRVLSCDLVNDG